MKIPVPGVQKPIGLGQVISSVLTSLFGIAPCPVCKERAKKINQAIQFKPWSDK